MAPDTAFEWASRLALLGWALLLVGVVFTPGRARQWLLLSGGRVVPLLLCAAYVLLLVQNWGSAPGGNFGSLAGVATLFASPGKLVGGWVHFLAFDLWLGRWMVDDVQINQRSRWLLLPSLPLTFVFGPAGLLLYCGLNVRPRTLPIL
jgi:hypothetical protein